LHVPQKILQVNIPNVPYFFAVRVNVDLGQYKAHQPPEECRPTIDIKFHMIMFPSPKLWMDTDREAMPLFEEAMRMVNSTVSQNGIGIISKTNKFSALELGSIFSGSKWPLSSNVFALLQWKSGNLFHSIIVKLNTDFKRIHSPCIILSPYEVYVTHRPNQKALVAFIYLEDYTFIEGRTIWGNVSIKNFVFIKNHHF
jgi:hypothetical protein